MPQPKKNSKQSIADAMKELQEALLENFEVNRAEIDIKLKKQRAYKRLLDAKLLVRTIEDDLVESFVMPADIPTNSRLVSKE